MCDDLTTTDNRALPSRPRIAAVEAAGGNGGVPIAGEDVPVTGRDVVVATLDGRCDAYLVAPVSGRHPAILMWPDIMSLRPAFRTMADRLARSGYAVLVVNPFYRSAKAPIVDAGETFDQPAVRDRITPWRAALTPAATTLDARAFVTFLCEQDEVDAERSVGVVGYCMTGPMMVRTAAAMPDRMRAGVSCHGAGLVTGDPDSPHRLVPLLRGAYLVAIAANDDARSPGDKTALRDAFADTGCSAEIDVYDGAMHGWCVIDSPAYDHSRAEQVWHRLLDLFGRTL